MLRSPLDRQTRPIVYQSGQQSRRHRPCLKSLVIDLAKHSFSRTERSEDFLSTTASSFIDSEFRRIVCEDKTQMNKNVDLPIGPAVKRRLGGRRQEDYAPSTEVDRKPAQVPIGKSCPDGDPVNIYKHTRLVVCLAGRHNQRNNVQGLSVLEIEKEKKQTNKKSRRRWRWRQRQWCWFCRFVDFP